MKVVELTNHIMLPVTNEEADVLSKFNGRVPVLKSVLDLREQLLAAQLVNKGALIRKNNNGQIEFYKHIGG
jgi:hypothetical protein